MKTCVDCKTEKSLDNFPYDKSRNRYLSVCKICTSIRTKNYQKQNPQKWKQYDKNRRNKRTKLLEELRSEGCCKCGDKRHYIIDFHHIDPTQKDISIADASIKKIRTESKKCILLCRNCHAEFHYLEKITKITLEEYLKNN